MTSKDIKENFERDRQIINKFYRRLPEVQKVGHDEVVAWSSDHSQMLTTLLDDLKKLVKPRYFELMPKKSDGSIRIYTFLESYLDEHHYRLRPADLRKNLNNFQKETPFKINELWFVSTGLRLILFHRFAQIVEGITIDQAKKIKITDLKNVILSFLSFNKVDWRVFFEETSFVEKLLRRDQAGIYPLMDFTTRDDYRHAVEHLALQSGKSEVEIAKEVLSVAAKPQANKQDQHIGYFLLGNNRKRIEQEIGYIYTYREKISALLARTPGLAYLTSIIVVVILGMLLTRRLFVIDGVGETNIPIYLLLLFASILVCAEELINYIFTKSVKPKALPKMYFDKEIPLWARTMLVIPTQLGTNEDEPEKLLAQLENNYLNNTTKNLFFALLLAGRDHQKKKDITTPKEKINIEKIREGIKLLNQKYSPEQPLFYMFLRPRIWNEKENLAIEWERKRGKIIEFNRLLRGGATTFAPHDLDVDFLSSIKYIITIDQGDLLPKAVAARLAATIAHPLNHAKVDTVRGITRFGYGLIQPQLSCLYIESPSLLETTFCGNEGWDSYSGVVSNIYQDVFGYGLFWGRGIYDVDVFNQTLDHCFPENTILSHDHLEGFYARTGYASDIQIFEEIPTNYCSYTTRMMRWIRGDWQNLPWVLGKVKNEANKKIENPLGLLPRFKLLENAIRSIFLPSIFLTIIFAGIFEKNIHPSIIYVSFGLLIFQPLLAFFVSMLTQRITLAWRDYLIYLANALKTFFYQIVFRTLFLGHLSFLTIVTIGKTLFRMLVSKKHLLEWQIFHHINKNQNINISKHMIANYYQFELFCLGVLALVYVFGGSHIYVSLFVLLSMATPVWAQIFSQNYSLNRQEKKNEKWFIRLALKTWRYFDETVSEKTNNLPPDRWQIGGRRPLSQMTSITNIGLYLLSLKVSHHFNYLSLTEYLSRSQKILNALGRMERFHGHFYNWYSIKTLKFMQPKYVSAVDSGNLIASLMTAESNFRMLKDVELWSRSFWITFGEMLSLTLKAMEHDESKGINPEVKKHREAIYRLSVALPQESQSVRHLYNDLSEINNKLEKHLAIYIKQGKTNNLRYWSNRLISLVSDKLSEIELIYPWLTDKDITDNPIFLKCERQKTLSGLGKETNILLSSVSIPPKVKAALNRSEQAIQNFILESNNLSVICRKLYEDIDLKFLYNKQQKLFYIGYNNTTKKYDRNHYDLLASESRLTSFVALALNQVPQEHWQALSRPIAASGGKLALLSWGGSLFEYLFPQIFMGSAPTSLMTKAFMGAITDHMKFAKKKNIPWGISESCYDLRNKEGDYQYALHGVPFLSLRPILKPDLVVSPYSSFLALEYCPEEAYNNLKRLEQEGAEGKYGFYEAVDYNKPTSRIFGGKPVWAFLSHHQSIILISIYNYLNNGGMRESFNQHPAIKPLSFILSEKATFPDTLRSAEGITQEIRQFQRSGRGNVSKIKTNFRRLPLVNLISNGKYRIYLNDRGEGFSQLENININPWHADSTLRGNGNHIYIWDENLLKLFSPTPSFSPHDSLAQTIEFTENETSFEEVGKELASRLTIGLIGDENLEYRILTIKNLTSKTKRLKIAFGSEQILANGLEDHIHPSFNRLKTKVRSIGNFWVYSRRQMSDEANIYTGLKSLPLYPPINSYVMTSRRDFVGRLPEGLPLAITESQKNIAGDGFGLIYGDITKLRLLPYTESKIVYLATASENQQNVIELMNKYQTFNDFYKSLREYRLNNEPKNNVDWTVAQKLLSLLLYRRPTSLKNTFTNNHNIIGLPELRNRIGANSDNPILATKVDGKTSKTAFRQMALYAQTLAEKGFDINLVIITTDEDGYFQSNLDFVEKLLLDNNSKERPSPVFQNLIIIKEEERSSQEIESLKALSTLYVDLASGSFISQIEAEYKKL